MLQCSYKLLIQLSTLYFQNDNAAGQLYVDDISVMTCLGVLCVSPGTTAPTCSTTGTNLLSPYTLTGRCSVCRAHYCPLLLSSSSHCIPAVTTSLVDGYIYWIWSRPRTPGVLLLPYILMTWSTWLPSYGDRVALPLGGQALCFLAYTIHALCKVYCLLL